jgi:hypothetical protein
MTRRSRHAADHPAELAERNSFPSYFVANRVVYLTGTVPCYQGECRLSHSSAGPITGRSCQPLLMTAARTESAVARSRRRVRVAWRSLALRARKEAQFTQIPTSG